MIAYRISRPDLEAAISTASADWMERAAIRTAEFKNKGRYEESSSIWSEIKPVYMALQGGAKCAYCERKLEPIEYGKSEQDVEHFRPKGRVRAWLAPKSLKDAGVVFTPVPQADYGYYLLPYELFNYSAACKPCNSSLKKDYFPIGGEYNLKGSRPKSLLKEKPYLIYPVGDFDEDPERLIGFHGVSPQAIVTSGYSRQRALVTIEFFKLDHQKRKNLFRERAAILVALFPQLERLADASTPAAKRTQAQQIVDGFTAPNSAHTSCARSFRAVYMSNPTEAAGLFNDAVELIASIS